ncbi:MAG: nitroreductase family protein [Candidatus Bathyarchaeia archaeon]
MYNDKSVRYVILLSKVSEKRITEELIKAHVAHLEQLEEKGQMVLAGPFTDHNGGMIIIRAESFEEAKAIAESDPFVKSGVESCELRTLQLSFPKSYKLEPNGAFLSVLRRRVTTRRFAKRDIPKTTVQALLDVASRAPSEFNLQPWRPVVCYSKEAKRRLRDCCFGQRQVTQAAVDVIIAASTRVFHEDAPRVVDEFISARRCRVDKRDAYIDFIRSYYGKDPAKLRLHAVKNAMLFGHQLLLAALSIGLAGFWLGGVDEDKVRATFGIPDYVVVAGVVGLGWPDTGESGQPHLPRLPMETIVSWERWGNHDTKASKAST